MNTPVLTVSELAQRMRRAAAKADSHDLRSTGETDAVLLGELTALDVIADAFLMSEGSERMDGAERSQLESAREVLGRAWEQVSDSVRAAAV